MRYPDGTTEEHVVTEEVDELINVALDLIEFDDKGRPCYTDLGQFQTLVVQELFTWNLAAQAAWRQAFAQAIAGPK